MLRDRAAPVDLFALVPALELRFEPELAELDGLLEDDVIFQQVKADLSRRRPRPARPAPGSTVRCRATAARGGASLGLPLAGAGAGGGGQFGCCRWTCSDADQLPGPRRRWPSARSLRHVPDRHPRRFGRWSCWTAPMTWPSSPRPTWTPTWWCAWPRTGSSAAPPARPPAVVGPTSMVRSSSSRTWALTADPIGRPAWSIRSTAP